MLLGRVRPSFWMVVVVGGRDEECYLPPRRRRIAIEVMQLVPLPQLGLDEPERLCPLEVIDGRPKALWPARADADSPVTLPCRLPGSEELPGARRRHVEPLEVNEP